ncbi:MAG: hypothetical protein WD696_13375 [Bryobacteraceae bacterium]
MSFEVLVLIVVLILLPLIQLLQEARKRNRRTPERAEGHPPPARQPLREPPPPHAPPRPAIVRRPLSDVMAARERAPAVDADAAGRVAPTPRGHRSARRRMVVAGLRNPHGLRHAIVLMTILGPCRASRP